MKKVRVGVVGCGNISGIYFKNMCEVFEVLDVVACADLDPARAQAKATERPGVKPMTVDGLLASRDIDIVLNITIPNAHASVAMAAVKAGKSVHNEKPFTIEREEARKLLSAAKSKGVLVGSAPDTFMGGGLQTCRKLIDDGWIGEPVAATAFMLSHGVEAWHPNPEFYYKKGGGPMFDMGPYYLTAMVALMGPVKRVAGMTRASFKERLITSQPHCGKKITVEVPTHVAGLLEFGNGAIGTLVTSFDVWGGQVPRIEIYGTEGSLSVPDPNSFGGPVFIRRARSKEWAEVPLTHGYAENSRGIAVADMAYALRSGRPHRANGALAYHVLDVMHAIHDASDSGKHVVVASSCERPAPLNPHLRAGTLDE